ncbi:LysR family transcriptional regulator [Microvirga sp. SRT01]|uniref:LysR family transcriptional regulator n=1 Tax=Sphingomonas longa TaxID=2778730 RepID=A0ABS2DA42_9SPHN|nr:MULTISPECIES: LysR family transcriptional regulator [Alphaproteobacteria]MBM6577795.1 LysR family transcriptional regulator [Sphingomonas sp. BT552]MBR7710837.1 LysR family transcriptional regulator [Microvirga sp. SRT01]
MIGNLTLDQLRVLVTIAETGSFSATGRKLQRAQSAISQAVANLEAVQGVTLFDRSGHRPKLSDIGLALVRQARVVLSSAEQFEALAAGTREGLEPELTVAIDPLVPTTAFIDSLHALRSTFPHLPVSFSTEGLRGAERRLRNGDAALAFCVLLPAVPEDVAALPLFGLNMIPVVATSHPLGQAQGPVSRGDLDTHVQLVLSDATVPDGPSYGVLSSQTWRFVELGRRMDFLRAGFGWCRMPEELVSPLLTAGELVQLSIEDDVAPPGGLMIYAAHMRSRPLGRAGAWLLDDLRSRSRHTT